MLKLARFRVGSGPEEDKYDKNVFVEVSVFGITQSGNVYLASLQPRGQGRDVRITWPHVGY